MKNKIFYAGFYDLNKSNRMFAIPAVAKMDYIINALNQSGYQVEIISPSFILESKYQYQKGGEKRINSKTLLWLPPSFGMKTKTGKYFGALFSFFFWFSKLITLKNSDTLIVYHAPILSVPIKIAKRIKKFQLIIEVEEIYTYAFNRNIKGLKKEIDFIKSADKHILVNDLIADIINLNKQKCIVCYGPYKIDSEVEPKVFYDDKIHLVYAGSFSKTKGGVHNAVKAAEYLPDEYVMHILGFGEDDIVKELKYFIDEINKKSKCKIIFEGQKLGKEYYSFMKGCDIGLNPQKWGDYMNYAYPSKVLVYLNLGLNVVTSPLKTLKLSTINSYLNYIIEESPEALAEAILNSKIYSKGKLKDVVNNLNEEFVLKIDSLIHLR